ncbi:MAG TPA: HlyD family efflux transporter periplasmic adaptor subunit [Saprospiraceae bacterium]|nr:HlyD family efflux transporter periplasmic adaptor subunit [Saprospiraceae bacterium]
MLNISDTSISNKLDFENLNSFKLLKNKIVSRTLISTIWFLIFLVISSMFLPWTQYIRSKGYVTTLNPYDRPQTIQTLIGGRIESWHVREGQYVNIGDTIVIISEVKEEYLDPDLILNTNAQIFAKIESSKAYSEKANNLIDQYNALIKSREVKLKQNEIKVKQTILKIQSDSIEYEAAKVNLAIAQAQLTRTNQLFNEGLKPLTDQEMKNAKFQETQAKLVELQNKLNAGKNELDNLNAEIMAIDNDFKDKIAKSRSEMMSALSAKYDTDATVGKLKSQVNTYNERAKNYVITSPINGFVTQAIQSGIGEIVKNGDQIVSIMPESYKLAVETYVDPIDLPLLSVGQRVMIQFDGWPAIVFSGWPNSSYGTFFGQVFAIDNFISDNGKYRVLVKERYEDKPWPEEVKVGGGANTISLLKQVKVGYEIWRVLNGFPADYYKPGENNVESVKTKAPGKKLK